MLYAVIGCPIKKTLSPAMHNAAFKYYGIHSQYIRMPVKQKDLGPVMKNLIRFGFKGVNITVPYKEKTIDYLDSISKDALKIKAVNTIIVKKGRLHGENTDIYGFYQSIVDYRIAIKGKKVLLIGAGGAGRAAGLILAKMQPAEFLITDISQAQSRKFCRRFNADILDYGRIRSLQGRCDIVVNAAPFDHQNLAMSILDSKGFYYDLNYIYPRQIKSRIRFINGLEMLVRQGARSFEMWTGKKAPLSVMRKAVR